MSTDPTVQVPELRNLIEQTATTNIVQSGQIMDEGNFSFTFLVQHSQSTSAESEEPTKQAKSSGPFSSGVVLEISQQAFKSFQMWVTVTQGDWLVITTTLLPDKKVNKANFLANDLKSRLGMHQSDLSPDSNSNTSAGDISAHS